MGQKENKEVMKEPETSSVLYGDKEISFTPSLISPVMEVPPVYKLTNDNFFNYLQGYWKRNLMWRQFGPTFKQLRASNTLVLVEEYQHRDAGAKYLRWSFGKSLEKKDLQLGFIMKVDNLLIIIIIIYFAKFSVLILNKSLI